MIFTHFQTKSSSDKQTLSNTEQTVQRETQTQTRIEGRREQTLISRTRNTWWTNRQNQGEREGKQPRDPTTHNTNYTKGTQIQTVAQEHISTWTWVRTEPPTSGSHVWVSADHRTFFQSFVNTGRKVLVSSIKILVLFHSSRCCYLSFLHCEALCNFHFACNLSNYSGNDLLTLKAPQQHLFKLGFCSFVSLTKP